MLLSSARSWVMMVWTHPRLRSRIAGALLVTVAVVAVVIRVWLALVNQQSNDPHLPVIGIIAFEHRFPAKREAWEAFQPKLYHATTAIVWRMMGTRDKLALTHAAQLVACAAAILTLVMLLRFLRERDRNGIRISTAFAFAVAALTAGFVGISAQATNDAFVILFASLTLYFGARFFSRWRPRDFAGLVVATVLAGLSKGNGLVVLFAVVFTFGIAFVFPSLAIPSRRRRAALVYGALFVALVLPAVAFVGPYAAHKREFGTPFVTNWDPSPRPHLWRETFVQRPGLTSVVHGLLTFRFIDLLQHPASTHYPWDYPRHRTSLWTRVYAHTHSLRFEQYPEWWKTESPEVRILTRGLFVLGLLPMAILGVGLLVVMWRCMREAVGQLGAGERMDGRPEWWAPNVLMVLAVLGHLAFVAVYSVRLRDFASMKQIFILPALLGFVVLFAEGGDWLDRWVAHRRGAVVLRAAVGLGLAVLLLGYVVDGGGLIRDLWSRARDASISCSATPGCTPPKL
jgi:hypothetical protein